MINYILPQLPTISQNREQFPLLTNKEEDRLYRKQAALFPRTLHVPGLQNQPLFKGGIISEEEIGLIATETARSITTRHQNKSLLLITILEGARPFADLVHKHLTDRKDNTRLKISRATIKIQSYESGSQTTERKVVKPLANESGELINNFTQYDAVILIDDLVDSGETIAWLVNSYFTSYGGAMEACFLLEKEIGRSKETQKTIKRITKVIGLKVPNEWVVGFGLDISLPRPEGEMTKHLFRGSLPGGIYAFNNELEPYLLEAFKENNQDVMDCLKIYQSMR